MRKLGLLVIAIAFIFASCNNAGNKNVEIKTFNDSLSYAIGNDIAKSFERSKIDSINVDILAKAMKDRMAKDTTTGLDSATIADVMTQFQMKMRAKQEAEMLAKNKEKFKTNLEEGEKFLAENKTKDGVVTTESGLQYKVLKEGKGVTPTNGDKVKVHYEGKLLDGTVFDSSYERKEPAEFGVTQVIPGWTEVLQLMKEGSVYEVYIPYNLAYGERGSGSIKPFSMLTFKVELIKVLDKDNKSK